jgi:hypothetical protein
MLDTTSARSLPDNPGGRTCCCPGPAAATPRGQRGQRGQGGRAVSGKNQQELLGHRRTSRSTVIIAHIVWPSRSSWRAPWIWIISTCSPDHSPPLARAGPSWACWPQSRVSAAWLRSPPTLRQQRTVAGAGSDGTSAANTPAQARSTQRVSHAGPVPTARPVPGSAAAFGTIAGSSLIADPACAIRRAARASAATGPCVQRARRAATTPAVTVLAPFVMRSAETAAFRTPVR